MMIAEIAGGTIYGSMALVADGWHMSTHAAALAIAALAYSFARRSIDDAASSPMCGQISNTADYSTSV
jgi:Co/Zn/Cd efflux system component